MHVTLWPIDRLCPYDGNPRAIDQAAIDKVATSLRTFGWRQPIVVDADGIIIAGHVRCAAARQLGMVEVPVHVAEGMTPDQARAYRLADNRTSDETEWDHDQLRKELAAMAPLDLAAVTGFDQTELDRLLAEVVVDDAPPESATQEVDVETFDLPHTCPRCGFQFKDRDDG